MICIIPARGGSTRIPRKNIKDFHGQPIINYSIQVAIDYGRFDHIYVSTEDEEIAEVAKEAGAIPYMRKGYLAKNHVGTQAVARDVLNNVELGDADYACVIYATAPLLTVKDLDNGYYALRSARDYSYAYSCDDMGIDMGNYYWGKVDAFRSGVPLNGHSVAVTLPPERAVDINTMEDWNLAEAMYDRRLYGN